MSRIPFVLILLLISVNCFAKEKIVYKWESGATQLKLTDLYDNGTADNIRARNQREICYYYFNQLRVNKKKISVDLDLTKTKKHIGGLSYGIGRYGKTKYSGKPEVSLKYEYFKSLVDFKIVEAEKFYPVTYNGRMINLERMMDMLYLNSGGVKIFEYQGSFEFIGQRDENIVININGRLKYLVETDWLKIISLEGYIFDNKYRWVGSEDLLCSVEREKDGKKFIAIVPIRRPKIELIPLDSGSELIDFDLTQDKKSAFLLIFKEKAWVVIKYDIEDKVSNEYYKFENEVRLIGTTDKGVILWNLQDNSIYHNDKIIIKNLDHINLQVYPEGKYIIDGSKKTVQDDNSHVKTLLFYKFTESALIKDLGLNKISKFGENDEIWILPAYNKIKVKHLERELNSAFLSIELNKIYYVELKDSIRKIKYIKLGTEIDGKNILIMLGLLLLVLLMNDLLKKAKVYKR